MDKVPSNNPRVYRVGILLQWGGSPHRPQGYSLWLQDKDRSNSLVGDLFGRL